MSQPTPPYEGQQPYQQQPYQQPGYQQPGYTQPATAYGQQGYGYQPTTSTNAMAIVSLIAGIAGLIFLPIIASIVAVITGPMAKKQIAQTGEQGEGMAKAGIITGWIGLALWILGILAVVLFTVLVASTATVSS